MLLWLMRLCLLVHLEKPVVTALVCDCCRRTSIVVLVEMPAKPAKNAYKDAASKPRKIARTAVVAQVITAT
jgi:hypothetical protein